VRGAGLAAVSECRKRRSKISLLPKWLSVFRAPYPTCYNVRAKRTFFSIKTRKIGRKTKPTQGGRSGAWTGCPRRLSSFRACPHPTGSSRLIDSAGSDLAGTARTECAQSLSSVLLTSARQGLDHKEGKYLGFKRKVKRYSDKLTSDKIIFLNYRQTFYQNTRKTCGRRRILSVFFKFPDRRHPSMGFNRGISYPAAAGSLDIGLGQYRVESATVLQSRRPRLRC
jgi:hypothetical protein